MTQLRYFFSDTQRFLGRKKWRIIVLLFYIPYWAVFWYRLERSLFLLFGSAYSIIRLPLAPLAYLIQSLSNLDIHYQAEIGPGLLILHPAVGVVISGQAIIGRNLVLTGGNVIGATGKCEKGSYRIGDDCELGANAVIIGPVTLGHRIRIGACACVVRSFAGDDLVLLGVPARAKGAEVE
jgi:serine O-acetyltransferase